MEKAGKRFHSNGKLLLSGEYLVLHGALSLAVPASFGQSLEIFNMEHGSTLLWESRVVSKPWFHCEMDPGNWQIIKTDQPDTARSLVQILKAAAEIRGDTGWLRGTTVKTEVEFDIEWGLGSSSSLISNIAWWAGIDPFRLSRAVSSGSGYDIACARSDRPLLYRIGNAGPEYKAIDFLPPFHDQLAFVHLGRKQDSASSVKNYLNKALVREQDLSSISRITEGLSRAGELNEFELLVKEHEQILSDILGNPPVKHGLFPDYPGEVKSLGAWGGDFVMITMHQEWQAVREYFSAKGMETIIPYNKMVKT